jgi:hypothetical protein
MSEERMKGRGTAPRSSRSGRALRVAWHVDVVDGRTVVRARYSVERPGREPVVIMRVTA